MLVVFLASVAAERAEADTAVEVADEGSGVLADGLIRISFRKDLTSRKFVV